MPALHKAGYILYEIYYTALIIIIIIIATTTTTTNINLIVDKFRQECVSSSVT